MQLRSRQRDPQFTALEAMLGKLSAYSAGRAHDEEEKVLKGQLAEHERLKPPARSARSSSSATASGS
jgi:hypothetical protein